MVAPHVPDACALIAYLQKETGWEKVRDLLVETHNRNVTLLMHNATVAEVCYDAWRKFFPTRCRRPSSIASTPPVQYLPLVNNNLIVVIGFYKTRYKVSFADCFLLATAEIHNATVVTSDHHEFEPVEKDGRLKFEWIR